MKYWKTLLISVGSSLFIGCGGGGSSGGNTSTPTNDPQAVSSLAKTSLIYSQSPRINEDLKLSIEDNTSSATTNYSWEVIAEPSSSNLQMNVSTDSKSLLLTPKVAGQYRIKATPINGDAIETQFSIVNSFPFTSSKLIGLNSAQDLSKQTGIISNQAWVYSETLDRSAIENIVSNYSGLDAIDYDQVKGLLVQFDDTVAQSQTDLNSIRAVTSIHSVDSRVFVGQDFTHGPLKVVDDGSAFDDGGDNWHLEHIGISTAWNITTGSIDDDAFYIGLADSIDVFHTKHEDLKGRFKEATRAEEDSLTDEEFQLSMHGTGVAGTIGAISNNKKGMSGINWSNQIIAGEGGYSGLSNIANKDKVLLINNSWSIAGYIDDEFEDDNPLKVETRSQLAYDLTRDIRKLTIDQPEILFIFAAGNGVGNGLGFLGLYGVDGRFDNPALQYQKRKNGDIALSQRPNVIMVAAHLIDNRLAFYSNYGESVDIAAAAGYKSTKNDSVGFGLPSISLDEYYTSDEYGTNTSSGSFRGTSSSSPVVTGVASLILAIDETFTPSEVKDILIDSASEFVTERYIHPGNEDEGFFGPGPIGSKVNIETLSHPIPILNAAAAVTMAKQIKNERDNPTNPVGAVGILKPITPLTTSETAVIPSSGSLPRFSILEETGTDGDIDQELFLREGISSLQVVDIQRDHGVSVICEDDIQIPFTLNEADYSTNTITDTFYENNQIAASCSSIYEPILPVTLTNANISDVLEDWGGEPVSSDCPITTNTPNPNFTINTVCTSVSLRNFLITDTSGKEHKVSIQVTTDAND